VLASDGGRRAIGLARGGFGGVYRVGAMLCHCRSPSVLASARNR
jgi:hypothetical protein